MTGEVSSSSDPTCAVKTMAQQQRLKSDGAGVALGLGVGVGQGVVLGQIAPGHGTTTSSQVWTSEADSE